MYSKIVPSMSHEFQVVPSIKPPVPPLATTNPTNNFSSTGQVSNLRKQLEDGKVKNIYYLDVGYTYYYMV